MFFFQGLTMGLAYVAPIGMQNLFVIHSALSHSLRRAIVTALIVLFFDISLSLSCFYGIDSLLDHLPWLKAVILGTGTLLILYMAYGMIRQVPDALTLKDQPASLGQTVSKACIVTWMNPQALIDGTMMLGAFRASLPAGGDLPFIFGFGSASILWFLTLSTVVSLLGSKFNEKILNIINKVCGAVIIFYGCKLLWSFVKLMGWL